MLALREPVSDDLFKRAEDIGVTAVMCSPWAMADDAIERFAEEILSQDVVGGAVSAVSETFSTKEIDGRASSSTAWPEIA